MRVRRVTYLLRNWRFWAGTLVSGGLLALLVFAPGIDRGELWQLLTGANYLYLAPAVALYFVGQWLRAWRWQFLLAPVAVIPVRRLFVVVNIGYMANNLLPARLGELVRAAYLAHREERVGTPASIATLSVERLYDGLTLLAIGAVTTPLLLAAGRFDGASGRVAAALEQVAAALGLDSDLLLAAGWFDGAILLMAAGLVIGFIVALTAFTTLAVNQRAAGWLLGVTRLLPARFRPLANTVILGFVDGLGALSSPRKHVQLFIYSLPVWLAEGAVYYILAYSFNLDAHFATPGMLAIAILLTMVTSNLITAIPATVGGIGAFEVVATLTLIAMGVAVERAIVYSVAVHLLALWLPVNIVGLALLLWDNVSLRGLTTLPVGDADNAGGAAEPTASSSASSSAVGNRPRNANTNTNPAPGPAAPDD